MKRKVFALLLAASLVSASISPVAADDFTIEMQEESQDIAFEEPAFAEETPVVEDVAEFEEENASNEEDSAAGFEEEDVNSEEEKAADDNVVEDSFDEDFAGEDETLAETQVENEESAVETVNLTEGIPIDEAHFPDPIFRNYTMDEIMNQAKKLGIEISAEEIENAEQVANLVKAECSVGQGSYLYDPMSLEEYEAIME